MNIKKTYVYKSIRMAAVQRILSLSMFFFYICVALLVMTLHGLFFEFDLDRDQHTLTPIFFFIFFLLFSIVTGSITWVQCVIALISPEKSEAAKRYTDYISFEDMCMRVESQYLWAPYHWEHWRLCLLKDFIIYEHYGAFFVIPYSAVQEIIPWKDVIVSAHPRRIGASLRDALSHYYIIYFNSSNEKAEFTYTLNAILQETRENGGHL